MTPSQESGEQKWACRRGCRESFTTAWSRDRHESKQHQRPRSEREATDAALKNSDLYRKRDEPGEKEMKVKLPLEYHIKLHGLKLLNNQPISVSVRRALERYFENQQKEREENG